MAVLAHVRAEPRRAAVQLHLPDQPALHQRVQAIIDGGVGNVRHVFLGAEKHFLGSRMIALLEQNVIDLLALRREPEAARIQPFAEFANCLFPDHAHLNKP